MLEIRHQPVHDGVSIQDAYDDFYVDTELQMPDSFYLWMIELLEPEPNGVLVDVACGQGRLVQLAARQGLHAVGTDISSGGLLKGARHAPEASWLVADGMRIPMEDATADYVVSGGSLEHYDDPLAGVREIARILKPGGRAVILLPNAYGVFGNIQHVWQRGEIFDDRQPLQRYATHGTWSNMLMRGGLMIERLVPYSEVNFPRNSTDAAWLARHPSRVVRGLLATLLPAHMANQLVYVCRRAGEGDRLEDTVAAYNPMWAAL
jgi:ubiquinone/menaquinone biosynthesis C-methylase UbiE